MQLVGGTPTTARSTAGSQPQGAAAALPHPRPAGADTLRVAQMNLWNYFDDVDDPKTGDDDNVLTSEQYEIKTRKIANAIVALGLPDVISLNEIEGQHVVDKLLASDALKAAGYLSVVGGANDERGLHVGLLYRADKLELVGTEEPNPKRTFPDAGRGQINPKLLYARAPLVVDFRARGLAQAGDGANLLTIAVNHFKSKLGGSAPEARRIAQGEYLGTWLDERLAKAPKATQLVMGDLNSLYGEGGYEKLANKADGTLRLYDTPLELPETDRYTYVYRKEKNMLDHMMVSAGRQNAIESVKILHVNSATSGRDGEWDLKKLQGYSDHDSLVTNFDLKKLLAAQK